MKIPLLSSRVQHLGCTPRASRFAVTSPASCDLHQQRALQERGYIITAIGKRSSLRCDGSATAGGCFRVGCHGDTLGPLPRGCSLEYPPPCLFSAIPSRPACPPWPYHPLLPRLFAPSLSLLRFLPPPPSPPPLFVRVFLPQYTYVVSRPPALATLSSSLPRHSLAGPFASFVPRLTPFQRWQRWLTGLSLFLLPRSLLLRRLIAHRPPRFYFVTASLIPRYMSLPSASLLSLSCSLVVLFCDNDQ